MSRALVVLVILLALLVALLAWLSSRTAAVPLHHIEKTVTLDNAADGAAH